MIINWDCINVPCEIKICKFGWEILLDYTYKDKYRESGEEIYLTKEAARNLAEALLIILDSEDD